VVRDDAATLQLVRAHTDGDERDLHDEPGVIEPAERRRARPSAPRPRRPSRAPRGPRPASRRSKNARSDADEAVLLVDEHDQAGRRRIAERRHARRTRPPGPARGCDRPRPSASRATGAWWCRTGTGRTGWSENSATRSSSESVRPPPLPAQVEQEQRSDRSRQLAEPRRRLWRLSRAEPASCGERHVEDPRRDPRRRAGARGEVALGADLARVGRPGAERSTTSPLGSRTVSAHVASRPEQDGHREPGLAVDPDVLAGCRGRRRTSIRARSSGQDLAHRSPVHGHELADHVVHAARIEPEALAVRPEVEREPPARRVELGLLEPHGLDDGVRAPHRRHGQHGRAEEPERGVALHQVRPRTLERGVDLGCVGHHPEPGVELDDQLTELIEIGALLRDRECLERFGRRAGPGDRAGEQRDQTNDSDRRTAPPGPSGRRMCAKEPSADRARFANLRSPARLR
jgi:hypothetical protein